MAAERADATVVERVVLLESLTAARWGDLTAEQMEKNLAEHWDLQMVGSLDGYSVAKKAAGSVERSETTSVGPLVVHWAVEMAVQKAGYWVALKAVQMVDPKADLLVGHWAVWKAKYLAACSAVKRVVARVVLMVV